MKYVMHAALVACMALGASGCASKPKRVDASQEGPMDIHKVSFFDIRPAIEDMCRKVSEKNAKGWPEYINLSTDGEKKPIISLERLKNNSGDTSIDIESITREIENMINEQGVCYLTKAGAMTAEDLEAVNRQREYQDSGVTNKGQFEMGQEDAASLVFTGLMTRERAADEDAVRYTYRFQFQLMDIKNARPMITTSKDFAKEQER